jgi:hypothetical protein
MTTSVSQPDSLMEQAIPIAESTAMHKSISTQNGSVGTAGLESNYEKLSSEEKRDLMYEGQRG